jgi:exonuclease SbcC
MRIERLSLKGVLRFTDTVALDFRDIPAGSLIAIVGDNGQGKTTLLESMIAAFYREWPSRQERELVDYATGRDSFLEVEAALDGDDIYRARVSLDGVKRGSDAVIERVRPDGAREVLNDGKVSTFDPIVARVLPRKTTVLASAFAAQNKHGAFSTLDRKGRRELFAELLDLDQLEQYATTARAAAAAVDRRLAELRVLRDRLRDVTTDAIACELEEAGNALQADVLEVQQQRERLADALRVVDAELVTLRAGAARSIAATREHEQLEARRQELQAAIVQLGREREQALQDEARALATITAHRDSVIAGHQRALAQIPTEAQLDVALTARLAQIEQDLIVALGDREERIANNQDLIARAGVIRAAVDELRALEARLADDELALSYAESAAVQAERALAAAQAAVDKAKTRIADRDRARRSADLIAHVPCGGEDAFAACQFLQDAIEARRQLVALVDVDAQHANALLVAEARGADLSESGAPIEARRQALHVGRQRQSAVKPDADRLPRLEAAETRVAELIEEQTDLRRRAADATDSARAERDLAVARAAGERRDLGLAIERATAEAERAHAEAKSESVGRRGEIAVRTDQLNANGTDVDRLLAALSEEIEAAASVREALAASERRQGVLREHWDENTRRLSQVQEHVAAFERRRLALAAQRAEADQLGAAVRHLETDLLEWEALARILGRDGLPVLEIDAAGPSVSAFANDLLQACYGGRFAVELVTQEAKAGGKGLKETFELKVHDGERGGVARDLTDLSGGEQVIVEEALKSALAMYVNQRSASPVRTIWRDETVGALDPENALRYVQMLRRLIVRSGAHHLFFICHNPDANALADVQLQVADGRVDIRYPPFTASEAA